MLGWTHTRLGHCIIIKRLCHDVPTWFKKQAVRTPIYSSEASLRLLPTPQLTRYPCLQHCYHVEREGVSGSADTSVERLMTTFQLLSPSSDGRISARGQVLCPFSTPVGRYTTKIPGAWCCPAKILNSLSYSMRRES
jgi:hypothetical protein